MKMKDEKDLKKQLLSSISDEGVPDLRGNIKSEYFDRQQKKKRKGLNKGVWLGLGIPAFAACLAAAIIVPVALSGQAGNSSGNDTSDNSTPFDGQVLETNNKHQIIAYGVVSGENLLSVENSQGGLSAVRRMRDSSESKAPDNTLQEHLQDVNPFMKTAEEMMDGSDFELALTYSEGETYPYTLTFADDSYLCYSETHQGYDDDEEEFSITGIYYVDGSQYEVTGSREQSMTTGESEYETEFKVMTSSTTYVVIESENETETEGSSTETEQSYTYSYYENGRCALEVSLSYETENNEEEMKIEVTTPGKEAEYIIDRLNEKSLSLDYEFEYEENEYKGNLTATVSDDGSTYTYSDGDSFTYTLPRN